MVDMSRVALVTGATQGLGFALAAGLARELAPGDVVYLTGRDPGRVRRAAQRAVDGGRAEVRDQVLDVREGSAIREFAREVQERHGGIDIVFSNAAARLTPGTPSGDLVGRFVDTNNLGATRMLRAFGPLLRAGGRLFVVASSFGTLRELPGSLHERFDTAAMTLDDVDAVMTSWRDAVIKGRAAQDGWPDWINIPSKVGQVAAVRVFARERGAADSHDETLVAAVCPGLIDTDASRPWFADMSSAQTPLAAATWPVELALADQFDPAYYGELVQFGIVLPWDRGSTREGIGDGATV